MILVLPRLLPPATAVDVSPLTPVTEADANSVGYATASARTFRVELSYLGLLLLLPPIPTAGGPCGTLESESFTDNIPCIDKVLLPYGPCAGSRTLTFLVSKYKYITSLIEYYYIRKALFFRAKLIYMFLLAGALLI